MKFEMANENQNQEIDEDAWTFVKEEWKKIQAEWISEEEQRKEEDEKRQAEDEGRIEEMWKNDKLSQWEWKKKGLCRENAKASSMQTLRKSDIPQAIIRILKHEVPKIVILKVKDASTQTDPNDRMNESKPSSRNKHRSDCKTSFKPELSALPEIKDEQPKEVDAEFVNFSKRKTTTKCWNCGSSLHFFYTCEVPILRCFCFSCGEPGRTRKNCPRCSKKEKYCLRCGKQGVTIPTCPDCSESKEIT